MMGTKNTTTASSGSGKALRLQARAWPRTSKVLGMDLDAPSPFRSSSIGVPFLWEDAPGRPKVVEPEHDVAGGEHPSAPDTTARENTPVSHGGGNGEAGAGCDGGDRGCEGAKQPLKLPPRLQVAATAEYCSLSPNTVLHGPYGGGGDKPPRPLRRSGSTASQRSKMASAGVSLWKKAAAAARGKKHGHGHDHLDAAAFSCRSPASSSSSSSCSCSSSISYFADDHRRQGDGHDDQEDMMKSTVRITRFTRNSSLPNVNTSHLWRKPPSSSKIVVDKSSFSEFRSCKNLQQFNDSMKDLNFSGKTLLYSWHWPPEKCQVQQGSRPCFERKVLVINHGEEYLCQCMF
uniref:Uncharacterized protein n=1 Tax=Leersia perrieri TaxID=77586 RepID=A0A0D9V1X7_9ORYZ